MASGFFVVGTNSFLGVLDLWVTGAQWKISQTILYGRDAILRVRDKRLIFNMIPQLWADVKYHVPTGFVFCQKAVFLCFCFSPPSIYPLNGYWKFRRRPMLHMRGAPQ